jgi:Transcription factor WhiB
LLTSITRGRLVLVVPSVTAAPSPALRITPTDRRTVIGRWERERRSQRGEYQEHHDWAELPPMPASMRQGLCVTGGYDPELWHPGHYDNATRAEALSICQRCPALTECREWSLQLLATSKYAIYGGMTANQRTRAQRRQRAQASTAAPQ